MGFDINGVWTSDFYPIQDKEAGIAILASKFQTLIQTDIKSGFNNCITRDGSGKPTANLNLNGHKIINLASGVNGTDAVTKGQMDTAIAEGQSGAIASSLKLFEFKWFDHLLEDMSWLRADTFSWQDGTVYTNAYNHLVDDIDGVSSSTETIAGTTITYYLASDGHKVVLADQETNVSAIYTATGVAWYYILDTNNIKFKLPRINPNTQEVDLTTEAPVVGTGMALGLTNGNTNYSLAQWGTGVTSFGATGTYGANVGVGTSGSQSSFNVAYGVTTDSTKSGIKADLSNKNTIYSGKKYLYFYVGQFTQTATEQTAGLNAELFNDKADIDLSNANPSNTAKSSFADLAMPSATYDTLTLGASGSTYQAPADGCFLLYAEYSSGSNACYDMYVNGTGLGNRHYFAANTTFAAGRCLAPVAKSQSITVTYNGTITNVDFKFIYAKGSEWEKQ